MRISRRAGREKIVATAGRDVADGCNFAKACPESESRRRAGAVSWWHERCSRNVRRILCGTTGRLLVGIVLVLLSSGVFLEGLLRIGARGFTPSAFGVWEENRPWEAIRRTGPGGMTEPVPGGHAAWRIQPWHRPIEYRLDDHGFRTAGAAMPSGAPCRVLALGDSHTFGYGVGGNEAWPAMVSSMLANVAVENGGVAGSAIGAMEAWLPDALAAAHPQVVVLAVTPWSLRDDPEPAEQHVLDARWPHAEWLLRRASQYSAVADQLSRFALQRSARMFGWPPPAPVLWELVPLVEPPAAFHARWEGVHARLARMVETVRRRGAVPILLFLPLDVQVSAQRNVLYRNGRLPYRTHGFVDRDYAHDDRYVRALDESAERLRVEAIDATPILRAIAPSGFLPDDYHLGADGHAHVAALMSAPIAQACAAVPAIVEVRARTAGAPSLL